MIFFKFLGNKKLLTLIVARYYQMEPNIPLIPRSRKMVDFLQIKDIFFGKFTLYTSSKTTCLFSNLVSANTKMYVWVKWPSWSQGLYSTYVNVCVLVWNRAYWKTVPENNVKRKCPKAISLNWITLAKGLLLIVVTLVCTIRAPLGNFWLFHKLR